jgi:hypothetical protein
MLTLRAETVDDINNALTRLGRLPRRQRVSYLARAKSKLMARFRKGEPVQELYLKVQRLYAQEKQRLDRSQSKPNPKVVDKRLYELDVGEAKYPKSERYRGLMVARGEEGYYVTDGKARSDAHEYYGHISDEEIEALVDEDHPES